MKKWFVVPAVVLIALAGAGLWHFNGPANMAAVEPASGAKGPAPVAVEAEKVTVGSIGRSIEAVGNLTSNESVTLSPEIAGRLTEILFAEGQAVKSGDPLIRLDDVIAKAELAQMEASLTLSQANYERAKTLFNEKTGTGRARDEALAKLRTDQAGVDLARARLEKTMIKAPFDGIIGLRNVSIGDYVNPGQDMVNIESIDPLKVDFRMPEIYLNVLKTGQTIQVAVDAFPGKAFEGEVYAIDPLVDSSGRTVVLRAKLPNPENLLRPGLFARVNLLVSQAGDAIIIPEQALIPQGNERFVYKIVDGKAVMVPVKTGTRREGQVEITDGLAQGDIIVTAGQMKLRPNSPVTILPPAAQPVEQTVPAAGAAQ